MPGPLPKDPKVRVRANKPSTAAKLDGSKRRRRPTLPPFRADGTNWHELTRKWWRDVWRSEMAPEYVQSDEHGLLMLAELVDRFWWKPTVGLKMEIRLSSMCFGLSPIDRRRLGWELAVPEQPREQNVRSERDVADEDPRDLRLRVLA